MVSTERLITRLTVRLELYINLIVVPLAVYYGTIAGQFQGRKLFYVLITAAVSAFMATLFGMSIRIWKLAGLLNSLKNPDADFASIKLKLLSYPKTESIVIVLRWVLGLACQYVIMRSITGITWFETIPIFMILILCIPINSIISYCTTEHILSPVLMDDRMKKVQLPRGSYTLFSVSFRTTLIVISVLIIPLVTLGHFLFISNMQAMRLGDLTFNVMIILALSLAAIFVTVHESNAGIQSGLKMTLQNLEELEKGNLQVEPIPLLSKGEIGVISQSVNVLAHSLRNSEEMFSKAFRSSPVGIAIWRVSDGCFLNVNESFTKISGFSREAVIGWTLEGIGLLNSAADYNRMVQKLMHQGQLRGYETEFRTRSGETRLAAISAEMIVLSDEQCMIVTIEDVTEKKALEREILGIGERERQKIGQDLHDDLAPHLIGIEVMSELLKKKLQEDIVPTIDEAEKVRSLIEHAIQKTRRLSRGLCPVFLADHGLESLLQEMASNIRDVYGISCIFNYQRSILITDISICTHIYYIVHEAINNAVRHGKADRINIELLYGNNTVTLTTEDNGTGMDNTGNPRGMGLKIMKFRANIIGADLMISSSKGKGTKVVLSFSYDAEADIDGWD